MVRFTFAVLVFAALSLPVLAEDRTLLGYGRLLTNDTLGDRFDRWRTGSLTASRVWGPDWTGRLPDRFGDLIELRWGLEVMTPENFVAPAPGDRPYAGAISVGLHTHFATRAADLSLGTDLVFVGPSTQLDHVQEGIHDILGELRPSDAVLDAQIEDSLHPTLVFEAGRDLNLGTQAQLRPFVEARAGVETYARIGFDLAFGELLQGELLARDPVSGHRYRVVRNEGGGFAFILGADYAWVTDSIFLPSDRGLEVTERSRVRAGFHWENGKGAGLFYGLTWLGKEFETQREGQLIGSLRLLYRF